MVPKNHLETTDVFSKTARSIGLKLNKELVPINIYNLTKFEIS